MSIAIYYEVSKGRTTQQHLERVGGFAFPQAEDGIYGSGLTVRDYLAAEALKTFPPFAQALSGMKEDHRLYLFATRARWAYEQADAMIEAARRTY